MVVVSGYNRNNGGGAACIDEFYKLLLVANNEGGVYYTQSGSENNLPAQEIKGKEHLLQYSVNAANG